MSRWLDTRGRGNLAIALCDRCQRKFPWDALYPDTNSPGLRVCSDDLDQLDPYRLPARQTETITLAWARPDPMDIYDENHSDDIRAALGMESQFIGPERYVIEQEHIAQWQFDRILRMFERESGREPTAYERLTFARRLGLKPSKGQALMTFAEQRGITLFEKRAPKDKDSAVDGSDLESGVAEFDQFFDITDRKTGEKIPEFTEAWYVRRVENIAAMLGFTVNQVGDMVKSISEQLAHPVLERELRTRSELGVSRDGTDE
jgi:hypothetical protein